MYAYMCAQTTYKTLTSWLLVLVWVLSVCVYVQLLGVGLIFGFQWHLPSDPVA